MGWTDGLVLMLVMAQAFTFYKLKQYSRIIALLDKGQQEILEDLTRPLEKRGRF